MAKALKKLATTPKAQTESVATPRRRAIHRDRLSCRIDSQIKQRAEEAATLLGQDLTAFTESALNEKAQAVIAQEEKLVLSERDFEKFVAALDNPPTPTPALVAARRTLRQLREAQPEGNW